MRIHIHLGQYRHGDTLIVGIMRITVRCTILFQSIFYLMNLRVIHSGLQIPIHLFLEPISIFILSGLIIQTDSCQSKQIIGNRVFIMMRILPPVNTSATHIITPSSGHIFEDYLRHLQILLVVGQFKGINPSQSPPAFVIVKIIDEVIAIVMELPDRVSHGIMLGFLENILNHRDNLFLVLGNLPVTDNRRQQIGGVPPAGSFPNPGRIGTPSQRTLQARMHLGVKRSMLVTPTSRKQHQ